MSEVLFRDTEKVLQFLLTLERDEKNTVTLGTRRYSEIKGISPEQFIQCLSELEGDYVSLYFAGQRNAETLSYVTLKRKALSYFEDKREENNKETSRLITKIIYTATVKPALFLLGAIATAIIGIIVTKIMG